MQIRWSYLPLHWWYWPEARRVRHLPALSRYSLFVKHTIHVKGSWSYLIIKKSQFLFCLLKFRSNDKTEAKSGWFVDLSKRLQRTSVFRIFARCFLTGRTTLKWIDKLRKATSYYIETDAAFSPSGRFNIVFKRSCIVFLIWNHAVRYFKNITVLFCLSNQ